jgi:hypothetical protein
LRRPIGHGANVKRQPYLIGWIRERSMGCHVVENKNVSHAEIRGAPRVVWNDSGWDDGVAVFPLGMQVAQFVCARGDCKATPVTVYIPDRHPANGELHALVKDAVLVSSGKYILALLQRPGRQVGSMRGNRYPGRFAVEDAAENIV